MLLCPRLRRPLWLSVIPPPLYLSHCFGSRPARCRYLLLVPIRVSCFSLGRQAGRYSVLLASASSAPRYSSVAPFRHGLCKPLFVIGLSFLSSSWGILPHIWVLHYGSPPKGPTRRVCRFCCPTAAILACSVRGWALPCDFCLSIRLPHLTSGITLVQPFFPKFPLNLSPFLFVGHNSLLTIANSLLLHTCHNIVPHRCS